MDDTGRRRETVAADMRALFADGRPPAAPPPPPRRRSVDQPARRRPRLAPFAILAAVGGIAGGLVLSHGMTERYPERPPVQPLPPVAERAASSPAPAPIRTAERPSSAAPVPVREADADPIEPALAPPPRPVQSADAADGDPCAVDERRCVAQDMAAADDRLRQAYADAVDAGVSPYRLLAARDRWARLRETGYDTPGRMIDGYEALADRLTVQARDARGEDDSW